MTNAEAYTKELMNEVAKEAIKKKTIQEIIEEELSYKIKPLPEIPTIQYHYPSGQEKRRERRKKQKPKKNN